jgi:hypothetical protein
VNALSSSGRRALAVDLEQLGGSTSPASMRATASVAVRSRRSLMKPAGWGRGSRRPSRPGACSSIVSRGQDGPRLVGAQRAGDLDDVRRRAARPQLDLRHAVDVVEDAGQLRGHPRDLVVAELQARQARHVQDLLAVDHPSVSLGRIPSAAARASAARGRRARAPVCARASAVSGPLVGERDPAPATIAMLPASPAKAGQRPRPPPSDAPTPEPGLGR